MNKRCLCRYAVSVRPFVCLSVMFVDSVKKNNRVVKFVSPSGIHTILVFPHQTSDGTPPPNRGVEYRWRKQKILSQYLAPSRAVNRFSGKCNTLSCDGSWRVYDTIVAGKWRCLLMAGDDEEVWQETSTLRRIQRYAVVNLKPKLTTALGIILLRLTTDRHKASRGLSVTAELLVFIWSEIGMSRVITFEYSLRNLQWNATFDFCTYFIQNSQSTPIRNISRDWIRHVFLYHTDNSQSFWRLVSRVFITSLLMLRQRSKAASALQTGNMPHYRKRAIKSPKRDRWCRCNVIPVRRLCWTKKYATSLSMCSKCMIRKWRTNSNFREFVFKCDVG